MSNSRVSRSKLMLTSSTLTSPPISSRTHLSAMSQMSTTLNSSLGSTVAISSMSSIVGVSLLSELDVLAGEELAIFIRKSCFGDLGFLDLFFLCATLSGFIPISKHLFSLHFLQFVLVTTSTMQLSPPRMHLSYLL